MNGINFSMDGPLMEGTWYNTETGDSFTVRDSYFQDNQLMVATTDGRVLDYNMIQNYLKTDNPPKFTPMRTSRELPAELEAMIELPDNNTNMDDMIEEDKQILGNFYKDKAPYTPVATDLKVTYPVVDVPTVATMPVKSEDQLFVERVLKKAQRPKIEVKIAWDKFPQKQLELLVDMMDVDLELISDYFINNITLDEIRQSIKEQITSIIKDKLDADYDIENEYNLEENSEVTPIEEKKPKSKTGAKSKKK